MPRRHTRWLATLLTAGCYAPAPEADVPRADVSVAPTTVETAPAQPTSEVPFAIPTIAFPERGPVEMDPQAPEMFYCRYGRGGIAGCTDQCDNGGDLMACSTLALTYRTGGPDNEVPLDLPRARALYVRACRGGEALSCAYLGRMLASGAGGPAEPAFARALLQGVCAQAKGFKDPSQRSRVSSSCDELEQLDRMQSFTATVTSASGLPGVAAGSRCAVSVTTGEGRCRAQVQCGTHAVYADGNFPCTGAGTSLAGGESMTTASDGDAAITIDLAARTLALRDDARGELGAFTIDAKIDP